MWRCDRSIAVAIVAAALQLSAAETASAAGAAAVSKAVRVEAISGTKLLRIRLTQKEAQRLDIQTAPVREEAQGRKITPYASVLYDTTGAAWVYTSPESLTYVRHSIVVELIKGEDAYLKDGPPVGTPVVTVGVPELYGTETGVGH